MRRGGEVSMINSLLERGVEEVIERQHLEKRLREGKSLKIKYGVDPTAPDIHLGHTVALRKLLEFQRLGHMPVLVIGDYTARIGDPSGKKKTRPMLSEKEIEHNAKTYLKQIGKILDMKKVIIYHNSKWFGKMSFADILRLAANFTVAQIMERDDFSKRFKDGVDIGLHELLYPVMQAYDSIMIKADVEIGGTDQKFNMLAGRDLQRKMGQNPQDVITVPLLVGTDGKEKMSKSLGNAIGISEPASEIYGKIMSIPDELIIPYFTLVTDLSDGGLAMVKKEMDEGQNPRDIKARLAFLITEFYNDTETAEAAAAGFDRLFKEKQVPKDMPVINVPKKVCGKIDQLLVDFKIMESKSEVRRLVAQGGIRINQEVIDDIEKEVCLENGNIVQVGKRKFWQVKVKARVKK